MRFLVFPIFAIAVLFTTVVGARAADTPNVDKLNKKIDNFTLTDDKGKPVSLHDLKDPKAVVVVFLSFECPVSNSYAITLGELHKKFSDKGVYFLAIDSEDLDTAALAKQAAEFKIPFPVLKDSKFVTADLFKAEVTPEAFVLDHNFVLRYRGRIDNTWAARLKQNRQTTSHELQTAIEDLLAGKDVREPATKAVGCPLSHEKVVKTTGKVTYHKDVEPILQNRCQTCHRPGEVGPFSLMTYKQAVNWATDIKEYTQSRKMPPWKPVDGPAFHNERKMTDQEIATLATWIDDGTPEGDAKDAPKPRQFVDGWQLGKPDLVLTVPDEFTLDAAGKDLFRVYVLPTNLTEDKYVTAVEVRPGNSRVVHHTLNFFDRSGARELEQQEKDRVKGKDEKDFGPGYSSHMGIGIDRTALRRSGDFGPLGGWAPGQMPRHLPDGTGWFLPKGSEVVVQVHYHRDGKVEKDKTSIGLYFAKKPIKTTFAGFVIPGLFLAVPASDAHFKVSGKIEVQEDCTLHSVMHHMHMLGKEAKVTVEPPDGKPYTLLEIKDWDYNWQETYWLKEPIAIKKGTKMKVEAIYDNSEKNPNNPFNPPKLVTFGEQTTNEMCFVFLGATKAMPGRIQVDYGFGGFRRPQPEK